MSPSIKALVILLAMLPLQAFAQGTFQITFDGSPIQPPGTGTLIQSYNEAGMSFTPIDSGSPGFVHQGGGSAIYPTDGTPYLQAGLQSTLMFYPAKYGSFGLLSVDLAVYSTASPAFDVNFIGYYHDGSSISVDFSGSGTAFQTFNFGSEWGSGLTYVEIPNAPWSLDNLLVTIPEPGAGVLFVLGVASLMLGKTRSRRLPAGY